MNIQLVINLDDVRAFLVGDLNLADGYLTTACFEAQEIGLKQILGGALLAALKTDCAAATHTARMTALADACRLYMAYETIAYAIPKVTHKVGNMGAIQSTDDKATGLGKADTDALVEEWQTKADYFAYELQVWLLDNEADYPELRADGIRANLLSMASCGIWLGGPRGRKNYGTR